MPFLAYRYRLIFDVCSSRILNEFDSLGKDVSFLQLSLPLLHYCQILTCRVGHKFFIGPVSQNLGGFVHIFFKLLDIFQGHQDLADLIFLSGHAARVKALEHLVSLVPFDFQAQRHFLIEIYFGVLLQHLLIYQFRFIQDMICLSCRCALALALQLIQGVHQGHFEHALAKQFVEFFIAHLARSLQPSSSSKTGRHQLRGVGSIWHQAFLNKEFIYGVQSHSL